LSKKQQLTELCRATDARGGCGVPQTGIVTIMKSERECWRAITVIGLIILFGVGIGRPAYSESYLYSGGSYSALSVPSAGDTNAYGINNLGQIVGGYCLSTCGNSQGFIYSNASYTTLNVPGAISTRLLGINDVGQIVGDYNDGSGGTASNHAFLYSGGTFTIISNPLAPNDTFAFGINNSGQIVGQYNTGAGLASFTATECTPPSPSRRPSLPPILLPKPSASTTPDRLWECFETPPVPPIMVSFTAMAATLR